MKNRPAAVLPAARHLPEITDGTAVVLADGDAGGISRPAGVRGKKSGRDEIQDL